MNSPIKLQITLTDAYKACLEAIVYVFFASSAIGDLIYSHKTTNDGSFQMLYQIILCKTITSIIYHGTPKYLLPTRIGGGGLVTKLRPPLVTSWTVACQAPLSLGFSRQEYWSGLPFPSPGDLPNPGIKPGSPALQADSLPTELGGKPSYVHY